MRSLVTRGASAIVAAAAFAACSSGGSHSALPPSAVASASPAAKTAGSSTKRVTLNLTIPKRQAAGYRRAPKWISASTLGARVTTTLDGGAIQGTPQDFNLTPGGGVCSNATDGSTTCALAVNVQYFSSSTPYVTIALYDKAPPFTATTQLLTYGAIATPIVEGQANTAFPLVLIGVVASVEAGSVTSLNTASGSASQAQFVLQGRDAGGNIILAHDGVLDPSLAGAIFAIAVPPTIPNLTLTNISQGISAPPGAALSGVRPGDRIQVSAPAGAPPYIGIPLEVQVTSSSSHFIGSAYVPNSFVASVPTNLEMNATPPIIAGGEAASPSYAYSYVAAVGSQIESVTMDAASHSVAQMVCTLAAGSTVEKLAIDGRGVAIGSGVAKQMVVGVSVPAPTPLPTSGPTAAPGPPDQQVDLYTVPASASGACANSIGTVTNVYDASANDSGAYVASIASTNRSFTVGIGSTVRSGALFSFPETQSATIVTLPPNDYLSNIGSSFGSLAIPIFGAAPGSANAGLALIAPNGTLQYNSPSGPGSVSGFSSPVTSLAVSGSYVYFVLSDNTLNGAILGVGGTLISAPIPATASSNERALAIGPDGNLWIATQAGLYRFIAPGSLTQFGTANYVSVVSSADGHLYLSRTDGGLDVFP